MGTTRRVIVGCAVAIIGSGLISAHASEQRRQPPVVEPDWVSPIGVSLTIGDQRYESTAPGKCTHAPVASIYQVMSELWTAQQSQDGRSVNLSLWRPKTVRATW